KATGHEQQMRITPTSGLPPDEIERLIKEAETYTETDRQAKEAVVLRNKLDTLLRNTQKSFTKFGGLLSQNDQDIAERVFGESDAVVKTNSIVKISNAFNNLDRIVVKLSFAMIILK